MRLKSTRQRGFHGTKVNGIELAAAAGAAASSMTRAQFSVGSTTDARSQKVTP
jgi:hypothetical protein